jgi:hypothetical protein
MSTRQIPSLSGLVYSDTAAAASTIVERDTNGDISAVTQRASSAGGFVNLGGDTGHYLSKTTAYTMLTTDLYVKADATSAPFTLTLPSASTSTGQTYIVVRTNSGANAITIDGAGAETINGATTLVLGLQYQTAILTCDGSNWFALIGFIATEISAATADAITDSTGGAASTTLAAFTNLDTLTDSTSGTADDTVADVSTAVTGVDGAGSNAASKADVDTRLTAINNNFKELTDQVISQKAANTVLVNAIASLAAEYNELLTDVADIRSKFNAAVI